MQEINSILEQKKTQKHALEIPYILVEKIDTFMVAHDIGLVACSIK